MARLRTAARVRAGGDRLDYHADVGSQLRLIVLDLARRGGGSGGLVVPVQPAWLARELEAAGDRWVIVVTHQPLADSEGGEQLLTMLDQHPRVIAAIAGHTHRNQIAGAGDAGGRLLADWHGLVDRLSAAVPRVTGAGHGRRRCRDSDVDARPRVAWRPRQRSRGNSRTSTRRAAGRAGSQAGGSIATSRCTGQDRRVGAPGQQTHPTDPLRCGAAWVAPESSRSWWRDMPIRPAAISATPRSRRRRRQAMRHQSRSSRCL